MSSNKFALVLTLCLQLAVQLPVLANTPPASGTTTTTATTTTTSTTTSSTPLNIDLSSTAHNLSAHIAGTITEGSATKAIAVNQLITAAEQAALYQVQNGGTQSLVLATSGAATGGSINITPHLASLNLGSIVVPTGVSAIDSASNLSMSGTLTNFGTIYAVSTTAAVTTATISASSIVNGQGALLTSVLPQGGLAGYANAVPHLNLSLNAVNTIINSGVISSAGSLTMTAGGSITNALPTGVTGAQPIMQAIGNVNMSSNIGSFFNSGLISSVNGNINLASQTASDIAINATSGTFQALNGIISVRDSSFAGKFNLGITGGDFLSQTLNLYSGTGNISVNANNVTGVMNLSACAANVQANSSNLQLGSMNLTGDPTIYNVGGNILLTNDLSFPGQDLAIVASGNIVSNGTQIINTSSTNNGGDITMVAGAAFSSSSGQAALSTSPDSQSLITITGGTASGGKIDLSSIPIIAMSSVGKVNSGGNITLIAYAGSSTGSGQVVLPSSLTVTSGTGGSDVNGNITIIAGAQTGNAINVGNLNAQGATNGTGNIYLLTSAPAITGCAQCTGNVEIVGGKIIQGTFSTDPSQYPLTNGSIIAGDLSSSGGSIQALAGGTLALGSVTTSGANANGVNGGITLVAGASSGNAIVANGLTTSGGLNGSGNVLLITSSPDASYCSTCTLGSRQANVGGNISIGSINSTGNVDVRAGGDLLATSITSTGVPTQFGGSVGIVVDNATASNHTFVVGAPTGQYGTDGVGTISVQAGPGGGGTIGIVSGGIGGISIANSAGLKVTPNGSGAGSGAAIGLNAKNGTLTVAGNWNENAKGSGNGGFLNFAGKTITFTSPVAMSADGAGTGNGGSISISANNLNLPQSAAIIEANGAANGGNGGLISITSIQSTTVGQGGLSAAALGGGTGSGGSVTLSSNGNMSFGSGAVSLTADSGSGYGGLVMLGANQLTLGSGNVNLSASSTSNAGGSITVSTNALTGGTGTLTANANSSSNFAGSVTMYANNISTGQSNIALNANSTSNFGGSITLQTSSISTGSGAFTVNANGGTGGGFINAMIDGTSGQSTVNLNANASGNQAGSGGTVLLSTLNPTSGLTVGAQAGQVAISATGYATDGSVQNGGIISVTAGKNLTVNANGIQAQTTAANGNGANLSFSAGAGGAGALQLNGNFQANGNGTGNGGNIFLGYAGSTPIVNNGRISARATFTGVGGTVTVANFDSTNAVALDNEGTITVANGNGSQSGSINISAIGAPTSPIQDVNVTGSGKFQGAMTIIGQNVSVALTGNNSHLSVGTIQSIGGAMTLQAASITANQNATLTSTGNMTLNTQTFTNDSSVSAGGNLLVQNAGNLTVSGGGSLTAAAIAVNSNNGSVSFTQANTTGQLSSTAGTSITLATTGGNLELGNLNAKAGTIQVTASGGNLNVDSGSALASTQGNVILQDNFSGGVVTLNAGVKVSALATSRGAGQIEIIAGATGRLTTGSTPSNMTITKKDGGQIYFDGGINNQGADSASVDGSRIVFEGSPSSIVLSAGDQIVASNRQPIVINLPAGLGSITVNQSGGTSFSGSLNLGSLGSVNVNGGGNIPGFNGAAQQATLASLFNSLLNQLNTAANNNPNGLFGNANGNGFGRLGAKPSDPAERTSNEPEYMPVAFIQPAASLAGAAACDTLMAHLQSGTIYTSSNANVFETADHIVVLKRGEMIFAASRATVIKSAGCQVTVPSGTIAHIHKSSMGIKVRNLFDKGGAVTVIMPGKNCVELVPGKELVVANCSEASSEKLMATDTVARRRIKKLSVSDELAAATSEYSLISLIGDSRLVNRFIHSNIPADKNLVSKILKLHVCLNTVTSSHGVFSHVGP